MKSLNRRSFNSIKIDRLINLFAFLLAFPFLDLFSNSAYFYVFVLVCFYVSTSGYSLFGFSSFKRRLFLMLAFGTISTLFHPPLESADISTSASLLMIFRHFYWFVIAIFIYHNFKNINWYSFAKWVTFGFVMQTFFFYAGGFDIDNSLITIHTGLQRNAFVFNTIVFGGFFIYYLIKFFNERYFLLFSIVLVSILLLTNGRSGAVIALLIFAINTLIFYKIVTKNIKVLLLFALPIVISSYVLVDFVDMKKIGGLFDNVSPRFAELIKGEDSGDLEEDKSWLIRELMLTKTVEIFKEYPILGIGYDHFRGYDSELKSLTDDKFLRLSGESGQFLNTRSTHNSYAEYLADTGIIGFTLLLSLMLPLLFGFFSVIWKNSGNPYLIICSGFIGACIHGYAITAFTGANFWLIMGFTAGFLKVVNSDENSLLLSRPTAH
jgi:O-antigen ligase